MIPVKTTLEVLALVVDSERKKRARFKGFEVTTRAEVSYATDDFDLIVVVDPMAPGRACSAMAVVSGRVRDLSHVQLLDAACDSARYVFALLAHNHWQFRPRWSSRKAVRK
jgi:hypothetical protein